LNLFCYDISTKQTKKITEFNEYDVLFPSLGPDFISFSNGGYIYLMYLKTEQVQKVNIQIAEDFPLARDKFVNVTDKIASYGLSPDGNRGLFSARGDIFTVPAEHGNIRNLTNSNGVHDRNAEWSPDAKWIAFVSDKTGDDEVYIIKPDGTDLTQLTNNAKSYRFEIKWSPDSKKIICSDKAMELYYIDIETKKTTVILKSKSWELRDYNWSPDSKWIAYTDMAENSVPVVNLYSLETGKSTQVTNEFFQCGQPAFSTDSKYLYFVSDRTFAPHTGEFEYNFTIDNMAKIYGVTLQNNLESPFAKFESDEAKHAKEEKKDDEADKEDKKDKKEKKKKEEKADDNIKIDLDNIMDRIFELPVPAANYAGLTPQKDKLYYIRMVKGGSKLYYYDFEEKEEKEVGDFRGYEISGDGKKIIFKSGADYYITKLKEKITPKEGKLDLAKLEVNLDRKAEWKEVFDESWRQMKYFFYDPNMHGVDWKKIYDRYAPLLPYVEHRYDLTYLIGEMIGELNTGHCYTGGGDMPKVDKVVIGLLGCS
jgi:tricorn protease